MFKYIGILLISVSVSAYGTVMSKNIKKATAVRQEICQLLKEIENGIRYGSRPVIETVRSINLPLLSASGFITALSDENLPQNAVNSYLGMISQQEKEKLYEFFSKLGKSTYKEKELTLCSSCIVFFENILKQSLKESASKELLYKKIGIIGGILAAIILI